MKDLVSGLAVLAAATPLGEYRRFASTPPEQNAARTGAPDSIDEGLFIPIHGIEQWITIRGRDRKNPVLMILAGPGLAMSVMAHSITGRSR